MGDLVQMLLTTPTPPPGPDPWPDQETVNYKTGIDVYLSGTNGTDYAIEYYYHNKALDDHRVVYIKPATVINMRHNACNTKAGGNTNTIIGVNGSDGIPDSGDEGIIRFKMDRDRQYKYKWAGSVDLLPAYSAPFTLASLEYETGVPVVGTTGPVPVYAITDKTNYYYRGIVDSFGDEWHTMAVGDDDTWVGGASPSVWSSDGRIIYFVVNPKTPCLRLRTATDAAQFYTTPPKAYFIPTICAQTSYVTDGVRLSLADIYGRTIYYKKDTGDWTEYTAELDLDSWTTGTHTLEYYCDVSYHKTRTIVKNPVFPSAAETHGNLLWGTADEYTYLLTKLVREPYATVYAALRDNNFWHGRNLVDVSYNQGLRVLFGGIIINSFVARVEGITTKPAGRSITYAEYAKRQLIENARLIDTVGFERSHDNAPMPSKELNYRGYYDVNFLFDMVYGYDILVSIYRSDQDANGLTAIEDLKIRDCMANFIWDSLLWMGDYQELGTPGMWGTARNIGSLMAAYAMPTYSSPCYGTSGFNGSDEGVGVLPYPDQAGTWKKILFTNDLTILNYPNLSWRFGIEEYNCNASGQYMGRCAYFGRSAMGHCFEIGANFCLIHLAKHFTNWEACALNSASGTLISSTYPEEGYFRNPQLMTCNHRFPDVAPVGIAYMATQPPGSEYTVTTQMVKSGIFGLVFFEDEWEER